MKLSDFLYEPQLSHISRSHDFFTHLNNCMLWQDCAGPNTECLAQIAICMPGSIYQPKTDTFDQFLVNISLRWQHVWALVLSIERWYWPTSYYYQHYWLILNISPRWHYVWEVVLTNRPTSAGPENLSHTPPTIPTLAATSQDSLFSFHPIHAQFARLQCHVIYVHCSS